MALNYAPDLVGCARCTSEFAEGLAARGHRVEVVTAPPYYPAWSIPKDYSGVRWMRESIRGVGVRRTPLYVPAEPTGLKRMAHLAAFGALAAPTAVAAALRFRPDLVFAVAPALAAAGAALAAARVSGAASWLHVQDFEVDAAFELGLLGARTVRTAALAMERALFARFDRVSSLSPAMMGRLIAKGVDPARATQLRNGVDTRVFRVFASTHTHYRQELGLPGDRIVALYSGNMAGKQGLESLGRMAVKLDAAGAPVTVILCGDGPARSGLEVACRGLANVRFLPLQPAARLPELLGTADIHLLPQRPEAADLMSPSKLAGMLASGRPVVAMARPGSDLAHEVEGCGLAVAPDADALTAGVRRLAANAALRRRLGAAARVRAETRWASPAILDGFEAQMAALSSTR